MTNHQTKSAIRDGRGDDLRPHQIHQAFTWERSQAIESLNVIVDEYRHRKTGAMHFHIAADNPENVFLVAFRTVPTDSTGVAHILEHTALCGSERYPVRDPFFMMIRRSLNTFMNAFTSSDWTAYPFASQNRKDFNNLLDVYLDAAFFARLDELDFAQEGHRIEFEQADNPESKLVYRGVVYNEMKGAMSSPVSTLWQHLTKHLFPTTTYHYNSGGDPAEIPNLSYGELKSFYRSHYHPSNAVFMTFGNIPAFEHHGKFEALALSRFERLDQRIAVEDERRYREPLAAEESYALDAHELTEDKTHIVLGWLLGKSTDLDSLLRSHLLSSVLLDNGASPLRHALETTDLGTAPSPLCGLEDSNREMAFMCGLEGSRPENAEALEALVLRILETVAEEGVPHEMVEAALHQLELSQREITGDHYPYGLQLILSALPAGIHYGDPIAALNLDPALERLREEIKDPKFIKILAREMLLENPHRVRLVMRPDVGLQVRQEREVAERLAGIKERLGDAERAALIARAKKLEDRQQRQDDPEILPKVEISDIPPTLKRVDGQAAKRSGIPVTYYTQGTNGLVYQQLVTELPYLEPELLDVLPYYTRCLAELGVGDFSYLETQSWQSRVCGSINAYSSVRGKINDEQAIKGHFILSGKALVRNHDEFCRLMAETFDAVRFDEHDRVREIIAQETARQVQSVTGQGHSLAMTAASCGMSPTMALAHRVRGLAGIRNLKILNKGLDDTDAITRLAQQFAEIHHRIRQTGRQFVVVAEPGKQDQLAAEMQERWSKALPPAASEKAPAPFALERVRSRTRQLWLTSTQVNFCAKAYPTVPLTHEDSPVLDVLAVFLRNGYLHRAIREQGGAYGGGASNDPDNATFRFFSYRDPRFADTLKDFDGSIAWLLKGKHQQRQLEESILGVIGNIDKPGSPAGEAKESFHNDLYGRTHEVRQTYRSRVLEVTLDDLLRVGRLYFDPERASEAVITSSAVVDQHGDLGMEVVNL